MTKINRIIVLVSIVSFGLLLAVSQSEAVTTKKLFLGPDDFKVDSPTFQYIDGGGTLESLSGQITFHARLNLPKGAVMKSVIFYGNDTFGGKVCIKVNIVTASTLSTSDFPVYCTFSTGNQAVSFNVEPNKISTGNVVVISLTLINPAPFYGLQLTYTTP